MYIKLISGEIYKTLLDVKDGCWIIPYERLSEPIYVDKAEIDAGERVESPINPKAYTNAQSAAAMKRLAMIQPLLDDEAAITDNILRREIATKCAEQFNTTRKRILRLYYKYLATGLLVFPRKREHKKKPLFDQAIKKYYFSAKRHSLRTTYEFMLLESYCGEDGKLVEDTPTFSAFRKYYDRYWSKNEQKEISRYGLTYYQRNNRMLYGSAMAYRDKVGAYQIDETAADIYLVSEYDRSKVIGRPNIYMATDTATGVITGLYVGFDSGEVALMSCIVNASTRKDKYCNEYGIELEDNDWPSIGLPSEILCDRGKEFVGKRTEELCRRYGVIINSAPPFRAELKPLIERMMGMIQDSYKSTLQGRGIINSDAQERWATDYREQAILTLKEYTKIVITAVLTLNKSRVLTGIGHLPVEAPHTPNALWNWFMDQGRSNLLKVDEEELYVMSLPRAEVKITRLGLLYKNLRYVPVFGQRLTVGRKVTFAYDDYSINYIYVINDDDFIKCHLAQSCERYKGYTRYDVGIMHTEDNKAILDARGAELNCRIQMRRQIRDIIEQAEEEKDVCKR